ncbi:YbjN domain-containing protein [Arenimonas oryziterrae]|uniref:YbjN domain-containing protein n=1 Tax=Arenimonas oryziterrae DSM 21050 = YC6267 TaxID=1121015 RepID=A0A091B0W9_9GAMM|nr:YbjN domain-containing protein [Arenimonas oryziterrae]KFN44484.1 hypothetical protein N789_00325 [Arenimonas oryziterrae DSM 21050 = YC6267]
MRRSPMFAAIAALLLSAGASVAQARDITTGISGAELVTVLQDNGYRAKLGVDGEGDPKVESAVAGYNFSIFMYGCEKGRCQSIQFQLGIDIKEGTTLDAINKWNRTRRFASVFMDEENDPYIQMDLDLEKGSSTEQIGLYLENWENAVGVFAKDFDL